MKNRSIKVIYVDKISKICSSVWGTPSPKNAELGAPVREKSSFLTQFPCRYMYENIDIKLCWFCKWDCGTPPLTPRRTRRSPPPPGSACRSSSRTSHRRAGPAYAQAPCKFLHPSQLKDPTYLQPVQHSLASIFLSTWQGNPPTPLIL